MDDNDDLDYGPEDLVSPKLLVLATTVLHIDMSFCESYDTTLSFLVSFLGYDLLLCLMLRSEMDLNNGIGFLTRQNYW